MSNRKLAKAIQGPFRQIWKLYQSLTKRVILGYIRTALMTQRRTRSAAGFILPTTVLLILVVTLTVGALTLRAFNRNTQVIGQSQQRVIYNAATPAIDRARAKIEFLFDPSKDTRYPGGVPSESTLLGMMLNDGQPLPGGGSVTTLRVRPVGGAVTDAFDPYQLPDEERVDINRDGRNDNAWSFRTDTNGDGRADATVIYSVIFSSPTDTANQANPASQADPNELLLRLSDQEKARSLWIRQGPLSNETRAQNCNFNTGTKSGLRGWFDDRSNTSILKKNFQVDAFVVPDNPNATAVTLEFQQDRQLNRGNKWGAWFRNDLEVYPGAPFNWNGAMHTEGSLVIGGDNNFNAHLISSPASCLFTPDASEITVTNITPTAEQPNRDFLGLVASGRVTDTAGSGSSTVYLPTANPTGVTLNTASDGVGNGVASPIQISIDPALILTEDGYQVRPGQGSRNNREGNRNDWARVEATFPQRLRTDPQVAPYVDDLYRADDRWGPKPRYDSKEENRITAPLRMGEPIVGKPELTSSASSNPNQPAEGVGLDGYWERRARNEGMRILVGERLELGNVNTWVTPRYDAADNVINAATEREGDPLIPPTVIPYPATPATGASGVRHIDLQRRTLRDNVSAVQATAVYHSDRTLNEGNPDFPIACLASTVHPGTLTTLRQSVNFLPTLFASGATGSTIGGATDPMLMTDFFTGRGTNGWEFLPPGSASDTSTLGQSAATFVRDVSNPSSALRIALTNLANFAGDPDGAYPPKQEAAGSSIIHPYPALTMWGNYSNLRRVLQRLEGGTTYADLSIADKTYLQTAACTVGMLAYNIEQIRRFDPANRANDVKYNFGLTGVTSDASKNVMYELAETIENLMQTRDVARSFIGVLPRGQLASYGYNPAATDAQFNQDNWNAKDYYNVPPEAWVGAIRQARLRAGIDITKDPVVRMAELIMLKYQIRRDRTFGFRPSPIFGEYIFNRTENPISSSSTSLFMFPSACDPDEFTFALTSRGISSSAPSTLETGGLPANPTLPANSAGYAQGGRLGNYRFFLSRLCGAINTEKYVPGSPETASVLPKFPALYYLFPEQDHELAGSINEPRPIPPLAGSPTPAVPDPAANFTADRRGEYDTRQPGSITATAQQPPAALGTFNALDKEPYVVDTYINTTIRPVNSAGARFRVVDATAPTNLTENPRADNPSTYFPRLTPVDSIAANNGRVTLRGTVTTAPNRHPDENLTPFPVPDRSVNAVALIPRRVDFSDWKLPYETNPAILAAAPSTAISGGPNIPTNYILAPTSGTDRDSKMTPRPVALGFLDRAFFDGRQLMLTRTMDIDLGMLRSKQAGTDIWLPKSGIVYAFREDAVREDAIARPAGTGMNLTNLAAQIDPTIPLTPTNRGVTDKPIDQLPDPDRRVHGFRLRNGSQVKRNSSFEGNVISGVGSDQNDRGLSFFSDQSVYIQGDFNLHQNGADTEAGTILEEFRDLLPPDAAYTPAQFYGRRNIDDRFANTDPSRAATEKDRWRPSEILADSITVLSYTFCDGSIADSFVRPAASIPTPTATSGTTAAYPSPDFGILADAGAVNNPGGNYTPYGRREFGLYGPGCINGNSNYGTSFHNQNRPSQPIAATADWVRENSSPSTLPQRSSNYHVDFTSPIKISRLGLPLTEASRTTAATPAEVTAGTKPPLPLPTLYNRDSYFPIGQTLDVGRQFTLPANTRVNTIIVGGINPSRLNQGYGGLHNFPRFLERWGAGNNRRLNFSGSFLQLSFTNYATAPYESEAWEPGQTPETGSNSYRYYEPPTRIWGYDVALQFNPASPAASRFVTASKNRNEYYTEPPANDPYINNLCETVALPANRQRLGVPADARINCPRPS
ncbi:hormogonium polysaccharide biosynthesis protein HpsA [Phormidesmis sp. 146-33]